MSETQMMQIDLGRGVKISAPIKMDMTLEEWIKMTTYINGVLNLERKDVYRDIERLQNARVRQS